MRQALDVGETYCVSGQILASVIRIASNPRAFSPPAAVGDLFGFVDWLRTQPGVIEVAPGPRHWRIFEDLVAAAGISGADITDAWLAALAIEHGCQWWSADEGFARFPSLRWHNPLSSSPHPS